MALATGLCFDMPSPLGEQPGVAGRRRGGATVAAGRPAAPRRQAVDAALDVEERVDALDRLQRDRRDRRGRVCPCATFPAMSASSKNLRRPWAQHSAWSPAPGRGRSGRGRCSRHRRRPAGCPPARRDAVSGGSSPGRASSGTAPPAARRRRRGDRRGHRSRAARSRVLPLASTGTVVSSPCRRSAASTCGAIRAWSGSSATVAWPPT